MPPGPRSLETILKRCGIMLESEQIESLWQYHQLLRSANAQLNLTRIHNFENMVLKHYVDSLLVLKYVELPSPLIDMGSGPGLPGIPLKIARPGVEMVLAEPRGARAEFLREVCDKLGLKKVEVYAHKLGSDYPNPVAGVISRAVGSIPETLDRVAACLAPGGRMIFMKGPECGDEVVEAESVTRGPIPAFSRSRVRNSRHSSSPAALGLRAFGWGSSLGSRSAPRRREAEPVAAFSGSIREISSATNPKFQRSRDLLSGPGIRKHGEAILAGSRVLTEVLARYPEYVLSWLTNTHGTAPPSESIPWVRLSDALFKQLDVVGTHAPLLLVSVPEIARWSDDDPWPEGCTLFVPFQDPENVGAVIRSAAAFGVSRVVFSARGGPPVPSAEQPGRRPGIVPGSALSRAVSRGASGQGHSADRTRHHRA